MRIVETHCAPMKATSNQKARPCMYPVVQVLNWRGISILSEWKGQPYVISNLDMDMDYLCSSFSWAEAKSVVWPMGRDMSIRMSNVSTMGCLKYSAIASGCKTDTSTPWNDLCCLKRGREYLEFMLVTQQLEPSDNTNTRSHTRSTSCPSAPDRVPRPRTELRTVSLVLGTSYLCKERRVSC